MSPAVMVDLKGREEKQKIKMTAALQWMGWNRIHSEGFKGLNFYIDALDCFLYFCKTSFSGTVFSETEDQERQETDNNGILLST